MLTVRIIPAFLLAILFLHAAIPCAGASPPLVLQSSTESSSLSGHLDILEDKTSELEAAIREQESFSYSVSHDLRAPLRHINSSSAILIEDYAADLPDEACGYLERIVAATRKMGVMIDQLLELSRVNRTGIMLSTVDLSALATAIATMLRESNPRRRVEFSIEEGVLVQGIVPC